ncbi:anti-sigma factor RsbA family regulatory protein [Streptomyces sp. NPDC020707]|jgi:anti-sigma regulatory factor (Ser/Thr protein kinase)|uniref:Sensor histidine kinase n=1 Tax=Streptomyces ortus TaxID=2867268 RepID=A0ABT3V4U8_9ACTN|nr:anti-sigma factor RsbA family regulatory protein [Streptomyces ortus]MCX4235027.1 sensor histidine kinase [Streptomyces ortus]
MTAPPSESFLHPALFYRDEEEYVDGTVPFIREGLAAGEPVAVAVPGPRLDVVRSALGDAAPDVRFIDMTRAGRNPGRIIPRVLRVFADAHPATRVRIIGEPIWPERTGVEYPACVQHEALINSAFEGRDATILCPYDEAGLDERVLTDAYATHPVVISEGRRRTSPSYAPERVVERYNEPLPVTEGTEGYVFGADELPAARYFVGERAARFGLSGVRLDDLALAVAELTTNSVVHGGGSGTVYVWAEDGQVVCEVRDKGQLTDPLAGRRPSPPAQLGGRGLLLVNYLMDLVRVHTGPDGTVVRCYVDV